MLSRLNAESPDTPVSTLRAAPYTECGCATTVAGTVFTIGTGIGRGKGRGSGNGKGNGNGSGIGTAFNIGTGIGLTIGTGIGIAAALTIGTIMTALVDAAIAKIDDIIN